MPDDFIGIDVTGVPELTAKLAKLPPEAKNTITDEVFKYLLNVLRIYPPLKSVSRAEAYPNQVITFKSGKTLRGYKSIKQFHYVMALVSGGKVPYHRRHGLQRGWQQVGRGYGSILANETPGAPFTMGDGTQSNHERLVGWKTIGQTVKERLVRIMAITDGAVKKAIRRLGLG